MGRRARPSGPRRRSIAKRGLLYVATGDNYSPPATELSDAIVALDLRSGAVKWSRQFTAGDTFSGACTGTPECGPDFDFGSSVMLVESGPKPVLVAGQNPDWYMGSTRTATVKQFGNFA